MRQYTVRSSDVIIIIFTSYLLNYKPKYIIQLKFYFVLSILLHICFDI